MSNEPGHEGYFDLVTLRGGPLDGHQVRVHNAASIYRWIDYPPAEVPMITTWLVPQHVVGQIRTWKRRDRNPLEFDYVA